MKSMLIVFLVLLIVGLYFFTEPTKGLIKVTGKAVVDITKGVFNEMKDSEEFNDLKQDVINDTKERLKLGGN